MARWSVDMLLGQATMNAEQVGSLAMSCGGEAMWSSILRQLSLLGFLGLAVLALLLSLRLGAEPAAQPKEITNSIGMRLVLSRQASSQWGRRKMRKAVSTMRTSMK